jgi:hypothetical protein
LHKSVLKSKVLDHTLTVTVTVLAKDVLVEALNAWVHRMSLLLSGNTEAHGTHGRRMVLLGLGIRLAHHLGYKHHLLGLGCLQLSLKACVLLHLLIKHYRYFINLNLKCKDTK